MARYLENQEQIIDYIHSLENSLVSLVEVEEGSRDCETVKQQVKRVKQKMKKRKVTKESSQSEEDEQNAKKRSVPIVILRRPNLQKAIKSKEK